MLEVPGIAPLIGIGVYYGAAMTEAATYRGQDICIVGAANSAGQGALFFSRYARQVTMLIRGDSLTKSMSQYLIDRILATSNIDVRTHAEITGVAGDGHLESVSVRCVDDDSEQHINASAMFIFIGAAPRSEVMAGIIERDENGFILTGPDLPRVNGNIKGWTLDRDPFLCETNVPGIFAVGDVRSGANRRVAAAVGEGSATVHMVHRYLETV